jgi:hypothetical protein
MMIFVISGIEYWDCALKGFNFRLLRIVGEKRIIVYIRVCPIFARMTKPSSYILCFLLLFNLCTL